MFWFIVCLILLVAAIAVFIGSFWISRSDDTIAARVISGVLVLVSVAVFFFDTVTTVSTKNVGVITCFGKPTGYLTNGIHMIKPWCDVTEISDAVQTDTYASDNGSDKPQGGAVGTCIHVRIERQATACVNTSVRWQIKPSGTDYLFRNFKDNTHITDNLVLRDLQTAVNQAFATYDPLGIDVNGNNTNPSMASYAAKVDTEMRGQLHKWIDVQSVITPIINYDAATQQKTNQLLQQIALTRVAEQSQQTALAQAKANEALAKSVSNDPNVLVSKCLDILKEAVDKEQALPAGFSCFGPSTTPIAVGVK